MTMLKTIDQCYGAMDRISRVLLRAGLALVSLMYLAAILLLLRYESLLAGRSFSAGNNY